MAPVILVASVLIAGAIMFSGRAPEASQPQANNVAILDGKQVVEISAKGGYSPGVSVAQAGIPTVLKLQTQSTFDCSAALKIPTADYEAMLPPTGETLIELPAQTSGSVVQGICSMGMQSFSVRFE